LNKTRKPTLRSTLLYLFSQALKRCASFGAVALEFVRLHESSYPIEGGNHAAHRCPIKARMILRQMLDKGIPNVNRKWFCVCALAMCYEQSNLTPQIHWRPIQLRKIKVEEIKISQRCSTVPAECHGELATS
jgi:hypothetical protein